MTDARRQVLLVSATLAILALIATQAANAYYYQVCRFVRHTDRVCTTDQFTGTHCTNSTWYETVCQWRWQPTNGSLPPPNWNPQDSNSNGRLDSYTSIISTSDPCAWHFTPAELVGAPRGTDTHAGVDITANRGDAAYALLNGFVFSTSANVGRCGVSVSILTAAGVQYTYCHLQDVTVRVDDHVWAGSLVGHVNSTGTSSTGDHLHVAVRDEYHRLQDFWDYTEAGPLSSAFSPGGC